VLVFDDAAAEGDADRQEGWRVWLHLFNTLQTLPGFWLTTASGLRNDEYAVLDGAAGAARAAEAVSQAAHDGQWADAIASALAPLRAGLGQLAAAGAPAPLVGLELAGEHGDVIADCELAWPERKLVVLRDDQADLVGAWQSAGWRCVVLDAAWAVDDGVWANAVEEILGLGT
jgi:DEAD/DEAH box helicase domain-containing protein